MLLGLVMSACGRRRHHRETEDEDQKQRHSRRTNHDTSNGRTSTIVLSATLVKNARAGVLAPARESSAGTTLLTDPSPAVGFEGQTRASADASGAVRSKAAGAGVSRS